MKSGTWGKKTTEKNTNHTKGMAEVLFLGIISQRGGRDKEGKKKEHEGFGHGRSVFESQQKRQRTPSQEKKGCGKTMGSIHKRGEKKKEKKEELLGGGVGLTARRNLWGVKVTNF